MGIGYAAMFCVLAHARWANNYKMQGLPLFSSFICKLYLNSSLLALLSTLFDTP